ncbi:MAG: isoprenylcysteine carboxyl methyltransferase family protein [Actinomycetales bacterium]
MTSTGWFTVLVAAVALERVVELVVSARHLTWARARGGVETGAGHYPFMAAVHTLLLVSCVVEVHAFDRPFLPWLGWSMVVVVAGTQTLRWWCVRTLGRQWNTRIVVVPGLPLVRRGPYRLMRHPNYVAVVAEVAALPLVHTAWLTALVFTVLNAVVLSVRIPTEQRALAAAG